MYAAAACGALARSSRADGVIDINVDRDYHRTTIKSDARCAMRDNVDDHRVTFWRLARNR